MSTNIRKKRLTEEQIISNLLLRLANYEYHSNYYDGSKSNIDRKIRTASQIQFSFEKEMVNLIKKNTGVKIESNISDPEKNNYKAAWIPDRLKQIQQAKRIIKILPNDILDEQYNLRDGWVFLEHIEGNPNYNKDDLYGSASAKRYKYLKNPLIELTEIVLKVIPKGKRNQSLWTIKCYRLKRNSNSMGKLVDFFYNDKEKWNKFLFSHYGQELLPYDIVNKMKDLEFLQHCLLSRLKNKPLTERTISSAQEIIEKIGTSGNGSVPLKKNATTRIKNHIVHRPCNNSTYLGGSKVESILKQILTGDLYG